MREMRWMLWIVRLARRPPSKTRVLIVVTAVGAALALVVIDQLFGWPDWLTVNRGTRVRQ